MLELETGRPVNCDIRRRDTLDSSKKAIAIAGDRWWPQTANRRVVKFVKGDYVTRGRNVMGAQMLELCIYYGTVLRLEKGYAW